MVDDEYQGYYLPAGSVVVGNAWYVSTALLGYIHFISDFCRSVLHDPIAYPSPHIFNPSRFLTSSGTLNPDVRDPDAAFGFGRRICPGRDMAYDSIWIAVASILAAFQILPALDSAGKEVVVDAEYTSGMLW
jgi:hypothetical protein